MCLHKRSSFQHLVTAMVQPVTNRFMGRGPCLAVSQAAYLTEDRTHQ